MKATLKKLGWGIAGASVLWAFAKTKVGNKVNDTLDNVLGNKS